MSIVLRIGLIISTLVVSILILFFVKKERLLMKYALIWIVPLSLMFISIVIPNFIEKTAIILGFEVASNMLFFIGFMILFLITFFLTVLLSKQSLTIRTLVQELSILKNTENYNNKQ